jgi:integrase
MARLLDQNTVNALTLADGQFIFDSEPSLRGFGVRLRTDAKGRLAKAYFVQWKNSDGSQRRRVIGNAARMTAAVARKKAQGMIAKVEKGNDPAAVKDDERKATTLKFGKAVEQYLSLKDVRESSLKITRLYLIGPYFAKLHSMPVAKITKSHVSEALVALNSKSGRSTANAARRHLAAFFAWCVTCGHSDVNASVGAIKFKASESRDRVLSPDELRAVWTACDVNTDFGRIVRLLTLTGCRREEIGGLRWEEVDLDAATITLPKERVKNHHAHVVPLAPAAVDILSSVERIVGREFVFGQRGRGFSGWSGKKQNLGDSVSEWTLHDLRRTFRTGLGRLGVPPHIAERCVNHHQGGMEEVYNKYRYEREIASAMMQWADHVASVVSLTPSKIVPIKRTA